MSIAFAILLYDSQGKMHQQFAMQEEQMFDIFDSGAVFENCFTFPATKKILEKHNVVIEEQPELPAGAIGIGLLRRNALRLALKTECTHIMYCDGDRLLHWLEHYPNELRQAVELIQQKDFVVLGRTHRAFDLHPTTLKETETIVNRLFEKVTGKAWDTLAAARGMSRRAAEYIVAECKDDAISNDVTWPLMAFGQENWQLDYLEVDGLEFETPDRMKAQIEAVGGLERWLELESLNLDKWLHRLELAKIHLRALKQFQKEKMLKLKLDLKIFDASKYQNLVQVAEGKGYGFSLLQNLLDEEDFDRKLFQLVKEGVLNSPQSDGQFESYEDFCNKLLKPYYIDVADGYIVAVYGDKWIGLTGISVDKDTKIGQSGLTVVMQEHQDKGIAKALKVMSLEQAVSLGGTSVVTENHVSNYPMLAINSFFGFSRDD